MPQIAFLGAGSVDVGRLLADPTRFAALPPLLPVARSVGTREEAR